MYSYSFYLMVYLVVLFAFHVSPQVEFGHKQDSDKNPG